MKKSITLAPCILGVAQISLIIGIIFLLLHLSLDANAGTIIEKQKFKSNSDSSVSQAIMSQLRTSTDLRYPLSVARTYRNNKRKLIWVMPNTVKTQAWNALLLLDCAVHYGLNRADYHPDELLYQTYHNLTGDGPVSVMEKARFDILLTDAMLTMINNLNYGKLNPNHTAAQLDSGSAIGYKAVDVLLRALRNKSFTAAIENAQPGAKGYLALQDRMRLITGQYTGDCYEIPNEEVRLMAINMERMRWSEVEGGVFITYNIPSSLLKFQLENGYYQTKVVPVGSLQPLKISTGKTKIIKVDQNISFDPWHFVFTSASSTGGAIYNNYKFSTARNMNLLISSRDFVRQIVINMPGTKQLQSKTAIVYILPKMLSARFTYFTCELVDGVLIKYNDVYHLDGPMKAAFYASDTRLVSRGR